MKVWVAILDPYIRSTGIRYNLPTMSPTSMSGTSLFTSEVRPKGGRNYRPFSHSPENISVVLSLKIPPLDPLKLPLIYPRY